MNFAALTKAPRESIIVLRGADKKQVIERAQDCASDLPVARFLREASGPVTIYWSAQ